MHQTEFESMLSKKQKKRRIMEGIITFAFLALVIVCCSLREATKEIVIHEGPFFIPPWEEVNYNNVYMPFIIVGLFGTLFGSVLLFSDFAFCAFKTIQKDAHYLTVYRGITHNIIYVNGEEKGRMGPLSYTNILEVWLPSGVRATVSFSRTIWYMAHISFSDDTASMEV